MIYMRIIFLKLLVENVRVFFNYVKISQKKSKLVAVNKYGNWDNILSK